MCHDSVNTHRSCLTCYSIMSLIKCIQLVINATTHNTCMHHVFTLILWVPGGRTADDIVRWLMKRTGPPATDLTEVDQAKKFSEEGEVVVIGFFEDKESAEAKAFITAADSYDMLPFGITSVKEVAEALKATMNTIVIFKKVINCVIIFSVYIRA